MLDTFFTLNVLLSFVAVLLLWHFLRLFVPSPVVRVFLIAAYLLHFGMPLRLSVWYPATLEPATHIMILIGAHLIVRIERRST